MASTSTCAKASRTAEGRKRTTRGLNHDIAVTTPRTRRFSETTAMGLLAADVREEDLLSAWRRAAAVGEDEDADPARVDLLALLHEDGPPASVGTSALWTTTMVLPTRRWIMLGMIP